MGLYEGHTSSTFEHDLTGEEVVGTEMRGKAIN
jgi:hypothetical protein